MLTLRALIAHPDLGLRALTGDAGLERTVSWVHVSELADPGRFLDGGELLLTTGMNLTTPEARRDFLAGLAGRVSGVGFGVGLTHDAVPSDLVDAARDLAFPVLEVPLRTPFMAISKAVSAAAAAREYAEVTRTSAALQSLTRAAIGPQGVAAVVRTLAGLLNGWAVILDAAGRLSHASPEGAAARVADLAPALDRLRELDGPVSDSLAGHGEWIGVQALGAPARGFLAVGRTDPLRRSDQHILAGAAGLLTLALSRALTRDDAMSRLRSALWRLLREGHPIAAEVAEMLWGPLPEDPVRLMVATGNARTLAAAVELLEGQGPMLGEPFFHAVADEGLVLLAPETGPTTDWLRRLPGRTKDLRMGVSGPVPVARLDEGLRQARQAAQRAARAQEPIVDFADLAVHRLLTLVPVPEASGFAAAVLDPLIRHDERNRGNLVASLTAWLREHGQWDPAAARLGVHRHTLRNRINKVQEITGRDLDSPDVRAEMWFALQLLHIDAGEGIVTDG